MFYFIAAVIFSTEFIWSASAINLLFIAGNTFIYYLSQQRLDVAEQSSPLRNALKCSIQSVLVITLCGWITQDRYLTMFYRERDIQQYKKQITKNFNAQSDAVIVVKSDEKPEVQDDMLLYEDLPICPYVNNHSIELFGIDLAKVSNC